MSSFDPPLTTRTTASVLVIAAVLVFAWVLYAARCAPMKTSRLTGGSTDFAAATDNGMRP